MNKELGEMSLFELSVELKRIIEQMNCRAKTQIESKAVMAIEYSNDIINLSSFEK